MQKKTARGKNNKRLSRGRTNSKGTKWMQQARNKMEKKGTIGLFTKKAKRAGMGVQQYARYVLAHKNKFSKKTIEEAVFARNAKKITNH